MMKKMHQVLVKYCVHLFIFSMTFDTYSNCMYIQKWYCLNDGEYF